MGHIVRHDKTENDIVENMSRFVVDFAGRSMLVVVLGSEI